MSNHTQKNSSQGDLTCVRHGDNIYEVCPYCECYDVTEKINTRYYDKVHYLYACKDCLGEWIAVFNFSNNVCFYPGKPSFAIAKDDRFHKV